VERQGQRPAQPQALRRGLAAYEEAIKRDPDFAYAWHGKGNVLADLKRHEEALAAYDEAIKRDPEYAYPWHDKGNVLGDLKRYDEALPAYDEAIKRDAEYAYPWHGKGNVLDDLKRHDEALAAYDEAIKRDPEDAYPWNGKGNVLYDLKRYDEALAAYDEAIKRDPEDASPWNGKGNVLRNLKRYDEALAAYDEAIKRDPEDAFPWHGKGNVLYDLKRYDEALAAYDEAIKRDAGYAHPWNGKGNVLGDLKRYDEALAAYEEAITRDSEYADPHYNLGLLHWGRGDPEAAAKAFRRAIDLGLDPEWKARAESWIQRANGMIKSKRAGKPQKEREQEDRASDPALVTTLSEEMKGDLDDIRDKKVDFKKRMAVSISKSRIIGGGEADDMLVVLRDWNSYSPLLRRELRDQDGPGPQERLGGGYFLVWKGHGIVIDPGVDFVTQLYRRGLSIADVDTVVVTHCHLDHTDDLEALVDLNYRHNQAKGLKPHAPNKGFRQIQFKLCHSASMKYDQYLSASGCCKKPTHLDPDGNPWNISKSIDLVVVPVKHVDINGSDDEAIGVVFVLKGDDGKPVLRVGITSDSRWFESLPEGFKGCDVLLAHLGTIEVGEEEKDEAQGEHGGGLLGPDLKNHLGTKGCFRLMHAVKPKLFILGEFGEELVETRFKILQVFNKLKPDNTEFVLGGDSNLAVGLGEKLSVCCSHPECRSRWKRIPLDEVHPTLGGDYLFQYICPDHELGGEG